MEITKNQENINYLFTLGANVVLTDHKAQQPNLL